MTIRWDNPTNLATDDGTPGEWWHVADDPYRFCYGDDDRAAMDETNWDAFIADLGGDDADDRCQTMPTRYRQELVGSCADGTCDHGWRVVDGELHVREESDAWEVWEDVARSLSNYPLLDESAYSEREWDAWQEYASDGWAHDLYRDHGAAIVAEMRAAGMPDVMWSEEHDDDLDLSDELGEYLSTDDWQAEAGTYMAYWSGWGGGCDDATAADVIARRVVVMWETFRMMAIAGHDWHVAAMGQATLPFAAMNMGGK